MDVAKKLFKYINWQTSFDGGGFWVVVKPSMCICVMLILRNLFPKERKACPNKLRGGWWGDLRMPVVWCCNFQTNFQSYIWNVKVDGCVNYEMSASKSTAYHSKLGRLSLDSCKTLHFNTRIKSKGSFKNSGNSLSDRHQDFPIWSKWNWENKV